MMLARYDNVYFIGIGGIGMSALARWFHKMGYNISGYDRTRTTLTSELEKEGMKIHFEDSIDFIPKDFTSANTLVVYTPAIPSSHNELGFFLRGGYTVKKRSETLGMVTSDLYTIAIAGTHGKTTTSAILAHILKESGRNMTAFLGGIASNYDSNFLWNGEQGEETIAVVEADEYDRSFLRLHPDIAVVTSMDDDHLDIYETSSALRESFQQFVSLLPAEGRLIVHDSLSNILEGSNKESYAFATGDNHVLEQVENTNDSKVLISGETCELRMWMPGRHNLENAIAASVAAHKAGVSLEDIEKAIASFRGIHRRFEYHIRTETCVFIDDYAHHPAELKAVIQTARDLYPRKKLTVVFQPHLYTRTRDFAAEFRKSLRVADELILLEIYPAREEPIPGITSQWLSTGLESVIISKEQLIKELDKHEIEVLLTVGAGDIDQTIPEIKEHLSLKYIDHEVES